MARSRFDSTLFTTTGPSTRTPTNRSCRAVAEPLEERAFLSLNRTTTKIPVLNYHRILPDTATLGKSDITETQFGAEMDLLESNGFDSITIEQFLDWRAGNELPSTVDHPFILTIDDGNYTDRYAARTIIDGRFKPVLAIRTKAVGTTYYDSNNNAWDRYLTWSELDFLIGEGWGVASHSKNHDHQYGPADNADGYKNTPAELIGETEDSRDFIENHTASHTVPQGFIHPYHEVTTRSLAVASQYYPLVFGGADAITSAQFIGDPTGSSDPDLTSGQLRRIIIDEDVDSTEFQTMLTTAASSSNFTLPTVSYLNAYLARDGTAVVDGGSGADSISIGSNLSVPTTTINGVTSNLGPTYSYVGASIPDPHGIIGLDAKGNGGNDTIIGTSKEDLIQGGTGDDQLDGSSDNDTIYGDDGNDLLLGGSGNDNFYAGNGNDTMRGGAGADDFRGEAGTDRVDYSDITGVALTITMDGAANDGAVGEGDNVRGPGLQNEQVWGGTATNNISVPATVTQGVYINGNASDDTIVGGGGNDTLEGAGGNDKLYGMGGNDSMLGLAGNDSFYGGDGNDTMVGYTGNDDFRGENGTGTVSYANVSTAVTVTLDDAANDGPAGETDNVRSLNQNEIVEGGTGNDLLDASMVSYSVTLRGNNGDDTLKGGLAADILDGGSGTDSAPGSSAGERILIELT